MIISFQGSVDRLWNSVPGPIGLPFVGYLPFFLRAKNPLAVFQGLRKRYGNVYGIKMGSANMVILSGKDNIRAAVVGTDDFSDRPYSMSTNILNEENLIGRYNYVLHEKVKM